MKKGMLNNMFRKARTVCSGPEERKELLTLAHEIAVSNGYEIRTSETRRYRSERARQLENPTTDRIPLCFPYISDEMSAAIRRCLSRADLDSSVSVIEVSPNNLKRQLVWNRSYDTICTTPNCIICPTGRPGDCLGPGVIYLISCTNCGDEYAGETITRELVPYLEWFFRSECDIRTIRHRDRPVSDPC
ncbi:hypothetical protein RB195_002778 [Necator americanus]|uniref:Uncharacterized protein n=1 Tax=Necator americanus TaxID=51031 RepID=A0ABR1DKL1_NECAM